MNSSVLSAHLYLMTRHNPQLRPSPRGPPHVRPIRSRLSPKSQQHQHPPSLSFSNLYPQKVAPPDLPERLLFSLGFSRSETLASAQASSPLVSSRLAAPAARYEPGDMAAENYWRYADARQQQQAMVAAAAAAAGMAPVASVAAAQTVGGAAAGMNQHQQAAVAAAAMAQQAAAPPLKRARPDFGGSLPPSSLLLDRPPRSAFLFLSDGCFPLWS